MANVEWGMGASVEFGLSSWRSNWCACPARKIIEITDYAQYFAWRAVWDLSQGNAGQPVTTRVRK